MQIYCNLMRNKPGFGKNPAYSIKEEFFVFLKVQEGDALSLMHHAGSLRSYLFK